MNHACTHAIVDPKLPVQVCSLSDEEFIQLIADSDMPEGEWLGHMLLYHTAQLAGFLSKLPPRS